MSSRPDRLAQHARLVTGRDLWTLPALPDRGLPSLVFSDGPHGLRREDLRAGQGPVTRPATCFPTASALAATWNPDTVGEVGGAIAREAVAAGVDVVLGPGANIKRTPLCGRNFEYFAEDPLLSARMAAAWIRGAQAHGVGACLKHLAANNQETQRMSVDAVIDERALREIYLASFERAIQLARPWTVMAAYNRLNGRHCAQDQRLLTDVLRLQWRFDGVVVSDWGAVHDPVAALAAGLDVAMPGEPRNVAAVLAGVRAGVVPPGAVEAVVERVTRLSRRTAAARSRPQPVDPAAHHDLARRVAAEAVVLLRNNSGLLPLADAGRIGVVGALAREPLFQGGGSAAVVPTRVDDAWSELVRLLGSQRLSYAPGYRHRGAGAGVDALDRARAVAAAADVVVAFVGLSEEVESEGSDRVDLGLPAAHDALVEAVTAANRRTVVVIAAGAPVQMPWAGRVPAIVQGHLAGQAGGSAVARVLVGAAEPGGRLAETFPVRWSDNPVSRLPLGPDRVEYREGVHVGYRYYDTAPTRCSAGSGRCGWSRARAARSTSPSTGAPSATGMWARAGGWSRAGATSCGWDPPAGRCAVGCGCAWPGTGSLSRCHPRASPRPAGSCRPGSRWVPQRSPSCSRGARRRAEPRAPRWRARPPGHVRRALSRSGPARPGAPSWR